MLKGKQAILPVLLLIVTLGLADGEPTNGQIKVALITLVSAVLITIITAYLNTVTTHEHNTERDNLRRNVTK